MPCQAPTALCALYTIAALLAGVSDVTASPDPSPRVFGLDFSKKMPRNAPLSNRLRNRQKTFSVDLDNADIA